jgi:hypothetical protein
VYRAAVTGIGEVLAVLVVFADSMDVVAVAEDVVGIEDNGSNVSQIGVSSAATGPPPPCRPPARGAIASRWMSW